MKRGILAAAMALTTAIGSAQSVTFTDVLDVSVERTATPMVSGTYVPVADKFIAGVGSGTKIEVFSGAGVYESDLNMTGLTPTGNGIFGLVGTDEGGIYAHEDGGKDIWRWSSITDTPTKVYDTVAGLQRGGDAVTIGNDIVLALTGSGNNGPVLFFSDSFPFASDSFSFNESAPLTGKVHLAMNDDATVIYTHGDTSQPITKYVKTGGSWNPATPAAGWPTNVITGGGPLAYDSENDILFALDVTSAARKVRAFDGTTGDLLGEDAISSIPFTTPGYAGSHLESTANAGTLWFIAPGPNRTSVNMYKWTYAVDTSSVDDWSLYQQ